MRQLLKRNILVIFLIALAVKIITVLCISAVPPMENQYIAQAEKLFNTNEKLYIAIAPGYSLLLYCFHLICGSWAVASKVVFIVFSFLTTVVLFRWAAEMFNLQTAKILLILSVFIPSLTVTYAGYTHSVVAGLFFFTTACYSFWKLMNYGLWKHTVCFALYAVLTVLIRPELILIISVLITAWIFKIIFQKKQSAKYANIMHPFFAVVVLALFLFAHKTFVSSRNIDQNRAGVFSDSRYSYRTFTHIFCVREDLIIEDSVAEAKASRFFGTARENNYSMAKAIGNNPKKYIENVLFNIKRSLDLIPHPLVIPFFLFFFTGLGIFNSQFTQLKYFHLFLLSIIVFTLITHSLFHVQIKYLANISIPVLLWSASGISQIESRKLKNGSIICCVAGLFFVYAMYLVYFMGAGARG